MSSTTVQTDKMTLPPIIVTAHVAPGDMAYFEQLRREHFPPHRNFLKAHITLFHHLPGRVFDDALGLADEVVARTEAFLAEVSGVRHLGAGVAFEIKSLELETLRADLFKAFGSWPGPQDRQKFKPHITVQNKVEKVFADRLYDELRADFQTRRIAILGIDLWDYLGGPWKHRASLPFPE